MASLADQSERQKDSEARQWFHQLKTNGEDTKKVNDYKNILSKTRSFDLLQEIFDMFVSVAEEKYLD